MIQHPGTIALLAKRLAMLANSRVPAIATAIGGSEDHAPEITGCVLGLMPHLIEKAVLTSDSVPADVASSLVGKFVDEYEELVKIMTTAGGFSNPVKKIFFKSVFHTMFRREYGELKPQVDKLWLRAREQGAPPLGFMAALAVHRSSAYPGVTNSDERIQVVYEAIESLFDEVHRAVSAA